MQRSSIEWTDATWNPVRGCTKISPGCAHCYAEAIAERFRGVPGHPYEQGFDVRLAPGKLGEPLRWRKPRRVFVNSMSDLFHEDVPFDYIDRVFAVMFDCQQHVFQILTKRAERMSQYFRERAREPLENVWLGVSVEDQKRAEERIPHLLCTPTEVRFLSCEPLLGPINFQRMTTDPPNSGFALTDGLGRFDGEPPAGIHWVIVGGESGHKARPMHPDWARSIRDQCQAADVPFFFKQWGTWKPIGAMRDGEPDSFVIIEESTIRHPEGRRTYTKRIFTFQYDPVSGQQPHTMYRLGAKAAGRELDGREWNEFPPTLAATSDASTV